MKTESVTPIHCMGFYLYAFGYQTDEKMHFMEKAQWWAQLKNYAVGTPWEDERLPFNPLADEVIDWYEDVCELGDDEMKKTLAFCMHKINGYFNEQSAVESKAGKMRFIGELIDMAKIDGEIKESEKAWINAICEIFEVDIPDV